MGKTFQTALFYVVVFCAFSTYIGYLGLRESPQVKLFQREIGQFLHEGPKTRKDNFLSVDSSIYNDLIINTTNCKIPNFDPHDQMAIPFVHKAEWIEDCPKLSYGWSYRNGNRIDFDAQKMEKDGFAFDKISCCYKVITRIEQSLDNYDAEADRKIEYSECHEMTNISTPITIPSQEFLMVECSKRYLPFSVVYRGFHAIAQPLRSENTTKKIQFWKNYLKSNPKSRLPPNIIILGTDTTSRLNFMRNMVQTAHVLEKLGAVSMNGYTKSGESTRAAFCTMLTGYNSEDLDLTCRPNSSESYDRCPLIWQRFSQANYLTAHSEDWPDLYAFMGERAAFVKQPVDYYLRTLMNAAHDYGLPSPVNKFVRLSTQWCIGHQTNDEVLIDYIDSVLDLAQENKAPLFALLWSDTYPHSMDHNILQLLDKNYTDLILRMEKKGQLENTILIFLSDHGQRYGPLRETLIGFYEDKLPNFWILLPRWLQEAKPEWQEALEVNSRRLTSPYTFYWTLNYILDQLEYFTENDKTTAKLSKPPAQPFETTNHKTGELFPRKYKSQNFFHKVPESNSCSDVGVPQVFCACNPLTKLELSDPLLLEAGVKSLSQLGDRLPQDKCAILGIKQITGGALMEKLGSSIVTYIIGLITEPGEMLIEAQIDYFKDTQMFSNSSVVQRANQINQSHIKCLKGDKTFQLYCYCTN